MLSFLGYLAAFPQSWSKVHVVSLLGSITLSLYKKQACFVNLVLLGVLVSHIDNDCISKHSYSTADL